MLRLFKEAWLLARYGMFHRTIVLASIALGLVVYGLGLTPVMDQYRATVCALGLIILLPIGLLLPLMQCAAELRKRSALNLVFAVEPALLILKLQLTLAISLLLFGALAGEEWACSPSHVAGCLQGWHLYTRQLLLALVVVSLLTSRCLNGQVIGVSMGLIVIFLMQGVSVNAQLGIDGVLVLLNVVFLTWDKSLVRFFHLLWKHLQGIWMCFQSVKMPVAFGGGGTPSPEAFLPLIMRYGALLILAQYFGVLIFTYLFVAGPEQSWYEFVGSRSHPTIFMLTLISPLMFAVAKLDKSAVNLPLLFQFYECRRALLAMVERIVLVQIGVAHGLLLLALVSVHLTLSVEFEYPLPQLIIYASFLQILFWYWSFEVQLAHKLANGVLMLVAALPLVMVGNFTPWLLIGITPCVILAIWWCRKQTYQRWQTCNLAGFKQHV